MLTAVLIASTAASAEKPRVVVLDFTCSSDSLKRTASSVAEQVLTELARPQTLEVLGTSDVSALLGMERQRQLLGCTENSSSCLAEISAAMGAPWLVMGNLAQLGKTTRLDIKLIRAADGKAVLREGKNLKDEAEVFDLVNAIVPRMLEAMALPQAKAEAKVEPMTEAKVEPKAEAKVEPKTEAKVEPKTEAKVEPKAEPGAAPPEAISTTEVTPSAPVAPWIVFGIGTAAMLGGAAILVGGVVRRNEVLDELGQADPLPFDQKVMSYDIAKRELSNANGYMLMGGLIAGVGVVGVVGGLTWRFTAPSGPAKVTVVPGPASLLVRGEF